MERQLKIPGKGLVTAGLSSKPRLIIFVFVALLLLNVVLIRQSQAPHGLPIATQRTPANPRTTTNDDNSETANARKAASSAAKRAKLAANATRMMEITDHNRDLVYVRSANVVILATPKGGTSKLWAWVYNGVTGEEWSSKACGQSVHDKSSKCWEPYATYVHALDTSEQTRVLTSSDTLRVAVYRDPFDRLISAFKSKFMCDLTNAPSDSIRNFIVPQLRRQCGLSEAPAACMDVAEFAHALDNCRRHSGRRGFIKTLRQLDGHIRPQRYFFDDIAYDMVVEINDMRLANVMQPLHARFPYAAAVNGSVIYPNKTGKEELDIPYKEAIMLHRFASQSDEAVFTYVDGHAPESFDHHI